MEKGLFNISSATTTTLISKNTFNGGISSISIANCSSSNAVTVTLYLDDDTNQTSIVENLNIPGGITLFLDKGITFDSSVLSMKLQTQGTGIDVNVIIK